MANYRNISLSFWTDSKIDDDFTPEDKYFYLYLLTNPHTNICGCYEISMKQMERETGYNADTCNRLLDRMEHVHDVIRYCKSTKEVLILHWGKYNWSFSDKVKKAVLSVSTHIKNRKFTEYIINTVNNITDNTDIQITDNSKQKTDTVSDTDVSIGYGYGIDTLSISYQKTDEEPTPTKSKQPKFIPPTVEEVRAYCTETAKPIDAEAFVDYFTSNGWKVGGKTPMKDWKAAVRQWRRRDEENGKVYKGDNIDHSLDFMFPG
jgi:hypothetical protein